MPVNVGKSGLLAKYGAKMAQAHAAHKNDETEFSQFGELPPGIENGIAILSDCKFDTFKNGENQGETFFYARGIVIKPETHEGIPIKGLGTRIGPEPLCDTPKSSRKTTDEHVKWIYNQLRRLGLETSGLNLEDVEAAVKMLKEAKPYFRFRTWKGKATPQFPNPKVNHDWTGVVEYHPDEDATSGMEDDTELPPPPPPKNGKPTSQKPGAPAPKPSPSPKPAPAPSPSPKPTPSPKPAAVEVFDEFGDLDTLGARAVAGDPEAVDSLTEMAKQAGLDDDLVAKAESWADVVKMLQGEAPAAAEADAETEAESETEDDSSESNEGEEESGEEESEPAGWDVKKGQIYKYRPLHPTTKKPGKQIDVEVLVVNKQARTVDLKNLDDPKKKYGSVSWDSLEE